VSKTTENTLLIPGESGWEIWTGQAGAPLTLHSRSLIERAGELPALPNGELILLFPVKAITAIPLRVASDDEALFQDLAVLHAERLGLRPDPMAGQLTDVFVIAREPENTALLSVLLRAPTDGDLPSRGPKGFDISPRAFSLVGDSITVWKEFGRWVFTLSHAGNLVYCQATSVSALSPDENLSREIRLALMQLSMQGLTFRPSHCSIWSSSEAIDPIAFQHAFGIPVEVKARPTPEIPKILSKLLPADVRAARRAALKRRNLMLSVAAIVLFYLGLLSYFGYGLWRDHRETTRLVQQAKAAAPDSEAYSLHLKKWDELAHAIDLTHSPVDILNRIAACIPPGSGLRLRTAEISATEIKLIGEAPQLQAVNSFSLNLSKSNDLLQFKWQIPEPSQSTRGWEFSFAGDVPAAETTP
jgi:hypothetical protein